MTRILAYLREHEGQAMLCVANLSRFPQAVELDLAKFEKHVPVEILGQEPFPPIGKLPYLVTLPGHGYFAFRLATDAKAPAWHAWSGVSTARAIPSSIRSWCLA